MLPPPPTVSSSSSSAPGDPPLVPEAHLLAEEGSGHLGQFSEKRNAFLDCFGLHYLVDIYSVVAVLLLLLPRLFDVKGVEGDGLGLGAEAESVAAADAGLD